MKIILLFIAYILIILLEVPKLVKNKNWRELVVFSIILSLAFVVSFFYILRIEIPNPVRDTQYFVQKIIHLSYDKTYYR